MQFFKVIRKSITNNTLPQLIDLIEKQYNNGSELIKQIKKDQEQKEVAASAEKIKKTKEKKKTLPSQTIDEKVLLDISVPVDLGKN